jgi:hypothetical protein
MEKTVEVVERPRITELEETNAQLRAELATANAKIAEVENRERALISDYGSLHNNYGDLESMFTMLRKEKVIWRRLSTRKLNDFASCSARNCTVSTTSWKNPLASLVGSALNF